MIVEGQPAPDFTLPDQEGSPVQLSSLKGGPVILYFYPKDDTSGCTKQACGFRDGFPDFEAAGATVLGISPDSSASHAKFVAKYDLPFTLLADVERTACEAYGVWKEKSMYGKKYMGVERTTFVLDRDGKLARIFPKVKVPGHAEAVLEVVRGLK
jgi:peroxiredoxin Q/BCP